MKHFSFGLLAILLLTSVVNAQLKEKYSTSGTITSVYDVTTGKVAYLCVKQVSGSGALILDAATYQTVMTISDPEFDYTEAMIPDFNQNCSNELICYCRDKTSKKTFARIIEVSDQSVVMEWKDPVIEYFPLTYVNKCNNLCLKIYGFNTQTALPSCTHYDLGMTFSASTSSIGGDAGDPASYSLHQNFPNPFNPSTTIGYNVSKAGPVKLFIYDMAGILVKTFEQDHSQAGSYQYSWNGTNMQGERVSSGMYIYELETGAYKEARKMVMLK